MKPYKEKLTKIESMLKSVASNAWRIAKAAVEVFEDREFRAEVGVMDDYEAATWLDSHFRNLPLTFLEMRLTLQEFPSQDAWKSADLRALYEDACERTKPEPVEREPRAVNRVTLKEHAETEQALQEEKARVAYLTKEQNQSRSDLEELRLENQSLKLENAELRGRISELERLVSRDPAVA